MTAPQSRVAEGSPRLHYLEWNAGGAPTIVALHGTSANAWWWQALSAEAAAAEFRILGLDMRGHGDSEWMRPPAYSPTNYADDLARFIEQTRLERPIVVGHSMGGIAVVEFAARYPTLARAAVAIDIAVTSTQRRNRFLQRLKTLPTVTYSDLDTAKARFRLMPNEGEIAPGVLAQVAEHSLERTAAGRYTMKFDRESFFGSDGIDVAAAIRRVAIPLLLVRAELSRIMTAEAAANAAASNPRVSLVTIPRAHHHVLLEFPGLLALAIRGFAGRLA